MKLTSVEIHPSNSSSIAVLSFRDPRAENPYNVKTLGGLDADEIVARYYGVSGNNKFYTLSLIKRTLVIRIGLNPDFSENQSYSDLRDSLYRMISSSRTGKVQVQFKNLNAVVAAVSGFVSKFESAHFEQLQEVQMTILCDDSMLKALNPLEVIVAGLDPDNTIVEDAISTAPHGFAFELLFTDNVASIDITDPDNPGWSFNVTPIDGFLTNDILLFSSELNDKYLYVVRGGDVFHLGEAIAPGSIWPIMFPGTNRFSLTNSEFLEWNSITYYPTYWGV